MLLARVIDWPEGSRLTGITGSPRAWGAGIDGVATLHLIDLPDGQQGAVEVSMAHAMLPFAGVCIHGVYPDGSEWILLSQAAVVHVEQGFDSPEEAVAELSVQMGRYLTMNPNAVVSSEIVMDRFTALTGFQQAGVGLADSASWAIDELIAGMMAEMCNVDLVDIAAGRDSGCTFPDLDHYCTGNGFTDVFAQWSRMLITPPDEA